MLRKLAFLSFVTVVAAGCRDTGGTPANQFDFAVHPASTDMAGQMNNNDMGMMLNYMSTNPHDIDTGVVLAGTLVKMTGLVAINTANQFGSSKDSSGNYTKCTYEVVAQDPTCTTAPCGLFVHIVTPFQMGSAANKCKYASDSGTFFATIKVGDNIDVTGSVDSFLPTGNSVTQHSVVADSVTANSGTATVTPMPISIAASGDVQFANCFTADGTGSHHMAAACPAGAMWQQYEGTLITVSPTSGGTFTTTLDGSYNFYTTPGNVYFDSSNAFLYDSHDAGTTVTNGSTFHSITGAVVVTFGGNIYPRFKDDFVK